MLSVTRRPTGTPPHPKLQELVHGDFKDFSPIADTLRSFNACFWCLGITSAGLTETQYTEITHDYTVAAARQLDAPRTSFVLVTGQGSDRSSSTMWARVKVRVAVGWRCRCRSDRARSSRNSTHLCDERFASRAAISGKQTMTSQVAHACARVTGCVGERGSSHRRPRPKTPSWRCPFCTKPSSGRV